MTFFTTDILEQSIHKIVHEIKSVFSTAFQLNKPWLNKSNIFESFEKRVHHKSYPRQQVPVKIRQKLHNPLFQVHYRLHFYDLFLPVKIYKDISC